MNVAKSIRLNRYLPLLLSFIFIDETCDNYLLNAVSNHSNLIEFILYAIFLLTSIVASPIQAGYSDFYCRKKSLIISLSCSLISSVLIFLSFQNVSMPFLFIFLALLLKAGLGNTLPLSWAAIADTQTKNFRFSLGLSTSAMAFGYLMLIAIKTFFENHSTFVIVILFLTLIYFCVYFFKDIRDKKELPSYENSMKNSIHKFSFLASIKNEISLIVNNFLKDSRTRKALTAFFFWEVSFYSALIADIDMKIKGFNDLSLSMLIGYLIGVAYLKFSNKSDEQMIKIGYVISIASLAPILVLNYVFDIRILMLCAYFIYSLAAAFLAPSLFSILSGERKPHEQGKIYGLIDSTDTIAFLIASIYLIIYNSLQLSQIFLVIFSLTAFLISLIPYAKFKKIKSKD